MSDSDNVVSLKAYKKPEQIQHVLHSRTEIDQIYHCSCCGDLQVIGGVCIHKWPIEDHKEKL
jgi:hypothetical protein